MRALQMSIYDMFIFIYWGLRGAPNKVHFVMQNAYLAN